MLINRRCFTFGIGSGASTALVRGIARAGNGSAEFIADDERMQSKVSDYIFIIAMVQCCFSIEIHFSFSLV